MPPLVPRTLEDCHKNTQTVRFFSLEPGGFDGVYSLDNEQRKHVCCFVLISFKQDVFWLFVLPGVCFRWLEELLSR